MRRFWLMHNCIGRLLAEKDLRSLHNASAAQSGEGTTKRHEHLTLELGEPVKFNPLAAERDETGFEALKKMAG